VTAPFRSLAVAYERVCQLTSCLQQLCLSFVLVLKNTYFVFLFQHELYCFNLSVFAVCINSGHFKYFQCNVELNELPLIVLFLLLSLNVSLWFSCTGSYCDEEHLDSGRRRHQLAMSYLCTPSTVFTSQETSTTHRNRRCGDQSYTCSQCGKCFSFQSSLCGHMNIHRSKHKCTECGKCCQNSYVLAEHTRTHSGEKPFECTVCGKRFSASSSLSRHRRIHSGDKPYKCHVCDKAFSESGHLNNHMRVHTGDKPYKCRMCDKAFSFNGNLAKHMGVHTSWNKCFKEYSSLQMHK